MPTIDNGHYRQTNADKQSGFTGRLRFGKGWMRLTNKKTARFREEAGGFSSSMIESVLT